MELQVVLRGQAQGSESGSTHPERLQQSARAQVPRLKDQTLNPNELLQNIKYNTNSEVTL